MYVYMFTLEEDITVFNEHDVCMFVELDMFYTDVLVC